jgi:polyisoprenoid-binding protein YceI
MITTAERTVPGYVAGTWTIDATHSEIGFSVRHMMVSKVRGKFTAFSGEIVTGESLLDSSVVATIDLSSIDTGNPDRDNHIRAADFFEVERYRTMSFRSTAVRRDGDHYALDGELTLKAVTKPITLRLDLGGFATDPKAGTRAGVTAVGRLNRRDFGVDFNAILETGSVVVGDQVDLQLEIEAKLNK